jgi:hypothetical protein
MREQKNGGYDLEGVIYHQHSNRLTKKILDLFNKDVPVIDIGCGHNFYVSVLNYAGYKAEGCDMTDLGSKYFFQADVTKPLVAGDDFPIKKRNVISLEVGEHIPAHLSAGYLDNVAAFKGDVIMSWAVKGQAGVGHINCQDNDWVIREMLIRGYSLDFSKTTALRDSVVGCHCSWFLNTLMYFTPTK